MDQLPARRGRCCPDRTALVITHIFGPPLCGRPRVSPVCPIIALCSTFHRLLTISLPRFLPMHSIIILPCTHTVTAAQSLDRAARSSRPGINHAPALPLNSSRIRGTYSLIASRLPNLVTAARLTDTSQVYPITQPGSRAARPFWRRSSTATARGPSIGWPNISRPSRKPSPA
jgi:hypothetical protein